MKKKEPEKPVEQKPAGKKIVICREIVEVKYDLNWFYMRQKILSVNPIKKVLDYVRRYST